jgi:hypothetical protein
LQHLGDYYALLFHALIECNASLLHSQINCIAPFSQHQIDYIAPLFHLLDDCYTLLFHALIECNAAPLHSLNRLYRTPLLQFLIDFNTPLFLLDKGRLTRHSDFRQIACDRRLMLETSL